MKEYYELKSAGGLLETMEYSEGDTTTKEC